MPATAGVQIVLGSVMGVDMLTAHNGTDLSERVVRVVTRCAQVTLAPLKMSNLFTLSLLRKLPTVGGDDGCARREYDSVEWAKRDWDVCFS